MTMTKLYGGIEAGGTKFVCAIGSGPDDLRAEARFPTTTPQETIARCIDFFRNWAQVSPLTAIGIASFGPVDLDPRSPTYGYIGETNKQGWDNIDFAGAMGRALALPIVLDTDVNGAALGERRWGAAQGLDTFLYLTVGTGIGGGGMVGGRLIHGLLHPEMGHIRIPHDRQRDPYSGWCPYHGDCLEGLAAGPALEGRWGQPGETLPPDHPAWELEAHYLALGLHNYICTFSPQRILLGGGIMEQAHLFPMIRANVQRLLNEYIKVPALIKNIEDYIVPPQLGNRAGVLGAIALAQRLGG
ncbi:MAG: ROK family protein [Chloroflexi bacterium]|nr:ROK family protein [Chloroflexota bacterium]